MEGAKILLVDDESSILRALTRALEDMDLEILTATSGQAGLELLESHKAAVILSDQRMPAMSGDEFLRRARKMQPCAVRIVLTGYADLDATMTLINTGGLYRYISKPWDDAELRMTVKNAVALHRMTVQNQRLAEQTRRQNEQLRALNERLGEQVADQTTRLREQNEALLAANRRQHETQWAVMESFVGLLEMVHPALHGHARRVATGAAGLARQLRMDESEVETIRMAALLHDVGKVGMASAVVEREPGRLGRTELEELRLHPERGQTILMAIEDFRAVGELIRHHHEQVDGRGYPDGLAGEAIAAGSRVIAIANAFDHAMRFEQEAESHDPRQAYERLLETSGSHLDAAMVTQFGAMMNLDGDSGRPSNWVQRMVRLYGLEEGMVLARNVKTRDGLLMAARGVVLDARVLGSIRRLAMCCRVEDEFVVYMDESRAAQPALEGKV